MATIYEIELEDPSVRSSFTHIFERDGKSSFVISEANRGLLEAAGVKLRILQEIDVDELEQRIIYPYRNFLYATPDIGAIEEICAKLYASSVEGQLPYAVFLGRNPDVTDPRAFLLDRVDRARNYQWKLVYTPVPEKSVAEGFPRLLAALEDPDTKVVLSFGAGGLRFFAHGSVMKFINALKARQHIDEVWGCSGGAFSAYAYAAGVPPEDFEEKGYGIYHDRYDLRLASSKLSALAWRMLNAILPTSPRLLKEFGALQILTRNALAQLVEGRSLEIPFYCTAYNVRTRRNDILTPLHPRYHYYQDQIIHADAIESVIASSSVPVVFVPRTILHGGREDVYIDGSVAEEVPLLPVYRKWVVDCENKLETRKKLLIIAIHTFPLLSERRLFKRRILRKVPFMDMLRFGLELFDLVMNMRFDEEFAWISQDKHVQLIRVNFPLQTSAVLDTKAIPVIIRNAQTALLEKMEEVERRLEASAT